MKQHQKKEDPNYQSLELKSGTSKDDHTASHQFSQASLNDTEMLEIKSFRSTENKVIELTQNESIAEHNQIKSELIIPQEEEEQSEDTRWQKFNFYMNTNIFGRIFLYDVFKLLLRAAKDSKLYKKLTLEDLPFLFPNHRTAHTHEKLQKYLDEAVDKAIKSGREIVGMDFVWMFLKLFKFEMILIILLQIFLNSSKMYSTIHMKRLIQSIEEKGVTSDAYMDALYLNATMIIYVLIYHNTPRINCMIFSIFRNAFMKALYQKVASLSSHAVKQANVGKLINLVANDLANVEYRFNIMVQVITTPYPLVIMCYLVYQNYGMLGIAGLSIMFLAGPLQMLISHLSTPYYAEKSKVVDDRVKLTNEIVEGIRLIKMYAWEKAFQKVILIIKKSEMRKNMMVQMLTLLNHSIELASSLFGAFITFTLVYYYRDGANLNLGTIFSTVDQFNYIKNEVISSLGWGIQGFFQLKVVLNRMVSVINLKNTSMTCIQGSNEYERSERLDVGTIQFKDFSAYWSANTPVLKDINLTLKKGEIVSVIGKVGAGKTSLLNCILKEIPMFKGSFNYRGKLAYVEQEPYIFNYSIRDNITFGKLYDEELYQNVIKACCLDVDLKLFQEGDSTQIGERGINISGGQKARISLARALYSEADIYLFDDPLSAVDAKVAKSLFFNVIKVVGKTSTVLFTTHQIHFSRYSDRVLIFEDGRIKEQGTYNELANEIKKLSLQLSHATEGEEGADNQETHHDEFFEETETEEEEKSQEKESVKEELEKVKVQPQNEKRKSISKNEEEIALKSKVNLDTYKFFYKSSNAPFVFFVILLMFVVSEVLFVVFSKTLGKISGDEIESNLMKLGWIVLFYFILQLVKNFFIVLYFNNAGYNIHQKMVNSLLRATVQFFDITPSGTILNLFSTDIGIIDTGLVNQVADVLEIMIQIFIFLGSIMIMTPYFIIVGILQFAVLTYFVRQTKIALFHTKQLDLNSRGPVFTFFNVVVQGVLPIRVYQQSQFFEKQYNILGDNSLRATWYFCLSSRGFGFFIHFMATVFNAIGIFLIIYVIKDSSLIGQSIILFMSSIELLQWGVRQIIQADVAMSSTQRCKNLVEELSEAELISQYDRTTLKISETSSTTYLQNNNLIQKFPSRGELVFQNVKMRYRKDLDLVLKDLTFKIEPGQRIGFVGRTGAGKSSLIQALFRMTEIENSQYFRNEGQQNQTGEDTEGNYIDVEGIYIDGHNIQKLGLHTLRSGISIIPQVPFVFSGTIRRNLDPLDEYTDDQILQVLEDIELLDKVNSLENKMDTDMTNTSQVFSAGQKQLICLGRAILRQSKLIVLDEATANCDMLTDELIQRKVRERFLNSTIITIAHRLNTIADYDQIIVVDKGQAVEQGSPYQLLQNQQGFFFQMVANTGTKNASVINKIASEKYQQSKSEER